MADLPLIGTNFGEGDEAAAPSTLAEQIAVTAANPKQASGDGHSVTSHSISDLIAADKYLAHKAAAAKPFGGIRIGSVRSSGSTGAS